MGRNREDLGKVSDHRSRTLAVYVVKQVPCFHSCRSIVLRQRHDKLALQA
jgi:hypothetical protein